MRIIQTSIPDLRLIEPQVFGDSRGFFFESFRADRFAEIGITGPFVQDNHSRSERGVLRGLHYQWPYPQGKLVRVLSGAILDVAVDLRQSSPTFGRSEVVVLSAENHRMLWVPRGFAHGFYVLSEAAEMHYRCDEYYHKESEHGIRWDDPGLGIQWGITEPKLSVRDAAFPLLAERPVLPE